MEKRLGKITNVKFGIGGYQDSQLGIHITLGHDGWGVNDSKSAWDAERVECSKRSQWTEEDRSRNYSDIMRYVSKLLKEVKVNSVDELKNKPVEITFDGTILIDWRILTEVL